MNRLWIPHGATVRCSNSWSFSICSNNVKIDPDQIIDVPNGGHSYNGDIQTFNYCREVGNQKRDGTAQEMWDHVVLVLIFIDSVQQLSPTSTRALVGGVQSNEIGGPMTEPSSDSLPDRRCPTQRGWWPCRAAPYIKERGEVSK